MSWNCSENSPDSEGTDKMVQWAPMRADGGGWSELQPSCSCRDAASTLPLCPMVGWVLARSCSRGMGGADFVSDFGCDLEDVDSYPVLECWMCGSPLCQVARVGLGLYRKGMILPPALETGGFDTLATDWKQCNGGLFGQLDYKLESLCQSWKGEGHVGWARRHQASGSGFCWWWWWLFWCCQAKSGLLLWSGQHLKRSEGTFRPWTWWEHQAWWQSSFLSPVWLWPEALLVLQNVLLFKTSNDPDG